MTSRESGSGAKKKTKWRFVYTGMNDAFLNMALDEALLTLCEKEDFPPILRLYRWQPKAVSIGYSQAIDKALSLERCREMNVDVVRRITGGRAVLHDRDLTYSVCASKEHFDLLGENVNETYKKISLAFLESLKILQITGKFEKEFSQKNDLRPYDFSKPCFSSAMRYEIHVDGRKLVGSAQRRFKNSFIQQGSILLESENVDLVELMPFGSGEERRKLRVWLKNRSICIESLLGENPGLDELVCAVKSGFSSFFSVHLVDYDISNQELGLAHKLVNKYRSESWTLRR